MSSKSQNGWPGTERKDRLVQCPVQIPGRSRKPLAPVSTPFLIFPATSKGPPTLPHPSHPCSSPAHSLTGSNAPWTEPEPVFLYFNSLALVLCLQDTQKVAKPTSTSFRPLETINSCPTLLISYSPDQTSSLPCMDKQVPLLGNS